MTEALLLSLGFVVGVAVLLYVRWRLERRAYLAATERTRELLLNQTGQEWLIREQIKSDIDAADTLHRHLSSSGR